MTYVLFIHDCAELGRRVAIALAVERADAYGIIEDRALTAALGGRR